MLCRAPSREQEGAFFFSLLFQPEEHILSGETSMIRMIRYTSFAMLGLLYLGSTAATLVGETTVPSVGSGTHAVDLSSGPRPDPPRLVFLPRRHIPLKGEVGCSPAPCIVLPSLLSPDEDSVPVVLPDFSDAGEVYGDGPPRDRAPPEA